MKKEKKELFYVDFILDTKQIVRVYFDDDEWLELSERLNEAIIKNHALFYFNSNHGAYFEPLSDDVRNDNYPISCSQIILKRVIGIHSNYKYGF